MIKIKGFKTVESDLDEINARVRRHRRKIFFRVLIVIFVLVLLAVGYEIWMQLRKYSSYESRNIIERNGSMAAKYTDFEGNLLEYSNDGISYMNSRGEKIWNQSFEMANPTIAECETYLTAFDKGGTQIYIMSDEAIIKSIETSKPIETVSIAEQGTVAVLMKEGANSYVKLYDQGGRELANGEFYSEQGSFPIDIALSCDAKKLAVDLVDISAGTTKSTITFYNFGSVGQNEIDNNVGTFTYEDMLIPRIEYVSSNRMVAFADKEFIIFEGKEKPEMKNEIKIPDNVQSVFYNDSYLGTVSGSKGEEESYHIAAYNMHGSLVMENDTAMHYDEIGFLDNNDICLKNDKECQIFTIHSVNKFKYEFDKTIDAILSQDKHQNYVFVFEDTIEEVRLK